MVHIGLFHYDKNAEFSAGTASLLDTLNLKNGALIDCNKQKDNGFGLQNFTSIYANNFYGEDGIIKIGFDGSKASPFERDEPRHDYIYYQDLISANKHEGDTTIILKNYSNDTTYVKDCVVVVIEEEKALLKVVKKKVLFHGLIIN